MKYSRLLTALIAYQRARQEGDVIPYYKSPPLSCSLQIFKFIIFLTVGLTVFTNHKQISLTGGLQVYPLSTEIVAWVLYLGQWLCFVQAKILSHVQKNVNDAEFGFDVFSKVVATGKAMFYPI